MKIKSWLIHKLGGKTQDDLYNQQYKFIQYQEGHVITYNTEFIINKDWPFVVEQAQDRLAIQTLDNVVAVILF